MENTKNITPELICLRDYRQKANYLTVLGIFGATCLASSVLFLPSSKVLFAFELGLASFDLSLKGTLVLLFSMAIWLFYSSFKRLEEKYCGLAYEYAMTEYTLPGKGHWQRAIMSQQKIVSEDGRVECSLRSGLFATKL